MKADFPDGLTTDEEVAAYNTRIDQTTARALQRTNHAAVVHMQIRGGALALAMVMFGLGWLADRHANSSYEHDDLTWFAEERIAIAQGADLIEAAYDVTLLYPTGAIVEKDRQAFVDVRLADGTEPKNCLVSTYGGRYELRCGSSYSWDEATPVPLAHPEADQD